MNLYSSNENPEIIMNGKPLIYAGVGILTSIGTLWYLSYNKKSQKSSSLSENKSFSENEVLKIQYNQIKHILEELPLEQLPKKEIEKNSNIKDLILALKQLMVEHKKEREKLRREKPKTKELLINGWKSLKEIKTSKKNHEFREM